MILKIGITGGIGSGKSTVCKIFKILGIPVFEADQVAKDLLNSDDKIKKKLVRLFGEDIYVDDKTINRKKLAELIFNDELLLQKVNSIIHPAVREYFFEWIKIQDSSYIIHEAAILFESGFYKLMDFNILVSADTEIRIKRVMDRDHVTRENVLGRINKQWTENKKVKLADTVIFNNNELLIPKVLEIDKRIKNHGKIW